MLMNHLTFAPCDSHRDSDVRQLFNDYSHKDHQLKVMGVSKERMVKYLEKSLSKPNIQSICLREKGRLVGLIALQSLPWMSEHFGLRMFAVPHLLAKSTGPLVHVRLLRYVIEELQDVDFLDCRVAVDDIYSAHALEICDFRYVGAEIYMGQVLKSTSPPKSHPDYEIRPCTPQERDQVLQIAGETHVHNRFVYDPIIHENAAKSLYKRLVANCFEENQFNVLVAHSQGEVQGFIISKMNLAFSQQVGQLCGSLDFIGVRPEVRNRGLGVVLNRWALYHLAEKNTVFVAVRTLASNYAALATCFRTGFRVTSTSLHFHKWIRRPALYHQLLQPYPRDTAVNGVLCHMASPTNYDG
jgi:ribosomal protein S18 acetylase RimI-like enzyme